MGKAYLDSIFHQDVLDYVQSGTETLKKYSPLVVFIKKFYIDVLKFYMFILQEVVDFHYVTCKVLVKLPFELEKMSVHEFIKTHRSGKLYGPIYKCL